MRLSTYSGKVFRNFAIIKESQDLMDDLSDNGQNRRILNGLFYPTQEQSLKTPIERVLEKSERQIIQEEIDGKFNPQSWYQSRYSDGTWPVLYAAESEETALREALFHMLEFYREELKAGPVAVQRRVLKLNLKTQNAVDLTGMKDLVQAHLISHDQTGYPYCQDLARKAIQHGAQLMRTPSARHPGGFCTPVLSKEVIRKDEGHLKYLDCLLKPDRTAEVIPIVEGQLETYKIN